jgi:V/A-type H+-transporting ATPase subunit A
VTQNTLKVVGAFYGLSRSRSDQRRYPAIDPLISWSLYLRQMQDSLGERCDGWVALVEEVHRLIDAGSDVHQMMLVVGEEGISLDDLITHLKSEIVDAVCLQQDSFDVVDRATSRERQVADFLLLMDMVHHAFTFGSKEEARRDMTTLHNLFFQMKYCPYGGETYQRYRGEIESMLAGTGDVGE